MSVVSTGGDCFQNREKAAFLEKAAKEGNTEIISQNHELLVEMLKATANDIKAAGIY